MRVLQINIFGNLSTGKIAVDIYRTLISNGDDGIIAYARNQIAEGIPHIVIGNKISIYLDGFMTRLTDRAGFFSKKSTIKLIKSIDDYNPDIIHLHNIHGYYINVPILFEYLHKCGKPVVWTLHDCWSFTGHCCYYSMANCEKWQTECCNCEQLRSYPASFFIDQSKRNYNDKKQMFLSLSNLHLVCVSEWLEREVKKSFLQDIPCTVIHNGIDTDIFRPVESGFREKHGLVNKKIILGVASTWDTRKGLQDFIELSNRLGDDYTIVLIGLNEREKRCLPRNILGIGRTDGPEELAGIYSTADVLLNASVEETFGLPTIEALACGTPAVVYNCTGLPETIKDGDGFVVEPHNYDEVIEKIDYICENRIRVPIENFRFSKNKTYKKYIELYEELIQV